MSKYLTSNLFGPPISLHPAWLAMPSGLRLPPELIYAIIADMADSWWPERYDILLKCALVSRDWLPASRSLLLDHVRIQSKSSYDLFVQNWLQSSSLEPYLVSTKSVELTDSHTVPEGEALQQAAPYPNRGWSHQFIHHFAGHLPNLESLTIRSADWDSRPPHPSIHIAISRFSSLKQLALLDCQFPSGSMLCRIVSALSSLEDLQLYGVTSRHVGTQTRYTSNAHGPSLQTLRLSCDSNCVTGLMRFLLGTPTRTSLREIGVKRIELLPHDIDQQNFMKEVAPGLVKCHSAFFQSDHPLNS